LGIGQGKTLSAAEAQNQQKLSKLLKIDIYEEKGDSSVVLKIKSLNSPLLSCLKTFAD
jgi:hypothetical protein